MERIGTVLRDLGGKDTIRTRLAQARALAAWPDIVGAELAERTRALRVSGDRLVVLAPGGALRQELTFHCRTILTRFNKLAGGRLAREVLFLESDSLDHDSPAPGAAVAVEKTAETDAGGPREDGAMYERFDAAAYRAGLEQISREQSGEDP